MTKDTIKAQVLNRIANGRQWSDAKKLGRSKYQIEDKVVHVRYRSKPKTDGISYSYNINANTLTADFEIWICSNAETYYFIPIHIICEIYNDPGGYIDKTHPNLHVSDVNTITHRTLHSRLGNPKILSSYFRAVMPPLQAVAHPSQQENFPEVDGSQKNNINALTGTPFAVDLAEPNGPNRISSNIYRILRDTNVARSIKNAHEFKCQICGDVIYLKNNLPYAEAHHIKPLGAPHNGPDIAENILCVCPNHHVQLDYGAIKIKKSSLRTTNSHKVGEQFIEYHNTIIYSDSN